MLCGAILWRFGVREGRGEVQGGTISRSSGVAVDGGELESAGAAHDLPAAESQVSAVGPAFPPAGGGAGPETVRRAFVPAAPAGPFLAGSALAEKTLPMRKNKLPADR